ncbi:MAG TPA: hypothetical protein VHU60_02335 [Gaiellaceae bacterium]|nr:hypothetical protein [Gaiellaceae bacterium]
MSVKSHRRQHAVGLGRLAHTGQELTDLAEDLVRAAPGPRHVVAPRQLDIPGSLDVGGQEARVLDVADRIVDAVDDQRRHVDRGDDAPHVDVDADAHERHRVTRGGRRRLQLAQPRLGRLRIRLVGKQDPSREPLAPARRHLQHPVLELVARALAPGPVVALLLPHLRAEQQQRLRSLRVRRGEQHRHRAAFGDADQRRLLGAGGVQHSAHVLHPLLQRADPDPLREPHAALVEQDQPRERGQLLAEAPVAGVLPQNAEVRDGAGDPDDVERTFAEHLVGDLDAAAARIPDLGRAHASGPFRKMRPIEGR